MQIAIQLQNVVYSNFACHDNESSSILKEQDKEAYVIILLSFLKRFCARVFRETRNGQEKKQNR